MKNYRLYEVNDFVLDEDFIRWVYEGRNDPFWKNWLKAHPEKQLVVAEARRILQTLEITPAEMHEEEIDEEVNKLMHTIHAKPAPVYTIKKNRKWWWAAASVILLSGIGWMLATLFTTNSTSDKFSYTVVTTSRQLIEQANTSGKPMHISLPDGSTVQLAPESRLSYASDFRDSLTRDVYLSGEAFFNVAKNPNQPFRVFTDELVTKVLGTSFSIRSFKKDKTIKVTVRTGKVNVYSQEGSGSKEIAGAGKAGSVLLTPNQQVIYKKKEKIFEKNLLEKPMIIAEKVTDTEMVFEDKDVIELLELFKKAYGISIVYDADVLRSCTITADLTNESLYTKLDLVCKAIDASYEIVDSEVFVHAKGCH